MVDIKIKALAEHVCWVFEDSEPIEDGDKQRLALARAVLELLEERGEWIEEREGLETSLDWARKELLAAKPELLDDSEKMVTALVIRDIARERHRQINDEGWPSKHDDSHIRGTLAEAGACYAMRAFAQVDGLDRRPPLHWPWDAGRWKPKTVGNASCDPDARRNLIIAAALIVAEIERFDRMENNDGVE